MTHDTITYRMVGYRLLIFVFFGVTGGVAVVLVRTLFTATDKALVVFIGFWLSVIAWFFYWFFFRVAYEVSVIGGSSLRWRTMAASNEAPLAQITGINTPLGPPGTGFRRISLEGRRSPLLIGVLGVGEVIAMVTAARPDIPVKTGRLDRAYERFAISTVRWRRVGGGGGS